MEKIILFAPLIGAILCGFGWRGLGERGALLCATGLIFLSALLSWVVFFQFETDAVIPLFRWIASGTLITDWAIRVDRLSVIMLVVITTVSALVHLYSWGYMDKDPQWRAGESYRPRFFAYLSLFTWMMLMLVTADNLLQLFFGWEGVGLASYLLIGFYYRKPTANAAAIKAFVVNRVGDFGFALGIFGLFYLTGSINFNVILDPHVAQNMATQTITFLSWQVNALEIVTLLLFVGAMGKSAQLFLHTWLPDAMEGPTPVSALIHAATMVTAGVFLICRISPLLEYATFTPNFIVIIGASTAFFAATVGLVQNDIKRVIAYSTCSQLGYMFVAAGIGAYQVAMFHLLTHAFFKALLFLGAGSVIHAMHHQQDMRYYGNLRRKIPITFITMLIGTLAITGVGIPLTHYGFAGFFSKDAIIESAFAAGFGTAQYGFVLLVLAAGMTSFYSWRLMFMTFYGAERGDKKTHAHAHESPWVMLVPLIVLAVGAIFAGMYWVGDFFGDNVEGFFGASVYNNHATNSVIHDAHYVPIWVKLSSTIVMLGGFALAWVFYIYRPAAPVALAKQQHAIYAFFLNKWYFDELYECIFTNPAKALGRFLWKFGDGRMIDGTINGIAMGMIPLFTRFLGRVQSGYLFHYAFAMLLGLLALIAWFIIGGGLK